MTRTVFGDWVRRSRVLRLVPLTAFGGLSPTLALAQKPIGPLSTSEQNPLYRLLFVPGVESADPVAEGTFRIEFSTSYSNVFEASERRAHAHLFDLEQMTNSLTLRYGLGASFEVGGRVGLYTGWEGFLDPVITGFHDLFGLPNSGRENQPEDQYQLVLEHEDLRGGSVALDSRRRTFSVEDIRLRAKWRFFGEHEDPLVVSLGGALRRAGGPLDAGRMDGAVSLYGRLSAEPLRFHGSAGLTLANPPLELTPITAERAAFFSTAIEYAVRPRLSVIGQVSGSTSYFRRFEGGELDGIPLNLTVGAAGRSASGWGWQVSFSEDLLPTGPAVDFTLDVQLSRTFREAADGLGS